MDQEVTYEMILSFPDQSHSFAHGVEFGLIYQRAKNGELFSKETVHAANQEVLSRMCDVLNLDYEFEVACDENGVSYKEWLYFSTHFSTTRSKKRHLSLVE